MSSSKLAELRSDIEELSRLTDLATRPKVKDLLSLDIRKLQTEITKLNEQCSSMSSDSFNGSPLAQSQKCYDVKLTNYAWDQTNRYIKLFVTLNNVHLLEPDHVSCIFSSRSMEMQVRRLENKNYFLTINYLLHDIRDLTSYWKVKKDTVVIYLEKVNEGVKWQHLTMSEQQIKDAKKSDLPEMDPNEDPSAGLMNLMKKMYNEGDDEMKRTIAKAWTEGREKSKTTLDDF